MPEDQFYQLSTKDKREIFNNVFQRISLPSHAVEKDWWVVKTLLLIFRMEVAPHKPAVSNTFG